MGGGVDKFNITPLFAHNIRLKARLNNEVIGLTELDKTKKFWFTVCCFKSDESYIVKIFCANKFVIIMCCRSIVLCLLNGITENIQITEGHIAPMGSRLASPDLRYWTFVGCLYPRLHPFQSLRNCLRNICCPLMTHYKERI
jgi:hypothetical protein